MIAHIAPVIRIVCAIAISAVTACLHKLDASILALFISFIILIFFRPNFIQVLNRLAIANIFILFIWFVVPFTTPGEPIWKWGILHLTSEGLNLCLLASFKANAIFILFLALVAPLKISVLGRAFSQLHLPDKLVWLFLLSSRNIHILIEEWNNLITAAKLRCFKIRNNTHTYKTLASLLAILLVRTNERGIRVYEAMLLRGYDGKLPFSRDISVVKSDIYFLITTTFFIICLIIIDS